MMFEFALFSQLGCNCYFTFWMRTFSGGLTASALVLLLKKVWNWSACSVFFYELVTGMKPLQWSKCSVSGTSEMLSFTWHQQKKIVRVHIYQIAHSCSCLVIYAVFERRTCLFCWMWDLWELLLGISTHKSVPIWTCL